MPQIKFKFNMENNKEQKKTFGQFIRNCRKKTHITQVQLSEKLDISQRDISRIENDVENPNFYKFLKLMTFYKNELGLEELQSFFKILD